MIEIDRAVIKFDSLVWNNEPEVDYHPLGTQYAIYLALQKNTLNEMPEWVMASKFVGWEYSVAGGICSTRAYAAEKGELLIGTKSGSIANTILAENYMTLWDKAERIQFEKIGIFGITIFANITIDVATIPEMRKHAKCPERFEAIIEQGTPCQSINDKGEQFSALWWKLKLQNTDDALNIASMLRNNYTADVEYTIEKIVASTRIAESQPAKPIACIVQKELFA